MQRFQKCLFFAFWLTIFSCTKDKLPEENIDCPDIITYNDGPKAILNRSCAYSGCHIAGYSSGDFSSYQAMKPRLDNKKFEKWVLIDGAMPPSTVPDDKPSTLTNEELRILKCWAREGYLER